MATANLVVNSVVNNRKSSEGKVNLSLSASFDRERLRGTVGRYLPTKNLSGALLK